MNDPEGLGWDRDKDPGLYDHYCKKLLEKDWMPWNKMTPQEREYVKRKKGRRRSIFGRGSHVELH